MVIWAMISPLDNMLFANIHPLYQSFEILLKTTVVITYCVDLQSTEDAAYYMTLTLSLTTRLLKSTNEGIQSYATDCATPIANMIT